MRLMDLVKVLDARARVTVWKSKQEKAYEGKVYGLFEKHDTFKEAEIADMYMALDALTILLK